MGVWLDLFEVQRLLSRISIFDHFRHFRLFINHYFFFFLHQLNFESLVAVHGRYSFSATV
jgi:hypothetical protein